MRTVTRSTHLINDMQSWPLLQALPQPSEFKSESLLQSEPGPVSGLYCLWDLDDTLVYIGQSKDIAERLDTHRFEGKKKFHRATYYPVADPSTRLRMEGILILASASRSNRSVSIGIRADGKCWDTTFTLAGRPGARKAARRPRKGA